jgi:phosphatidylglycerol:prolipoprotein diacylglycerol transferase
MSGLAFASPGPIAVSLGPLSIRWYGLLLGGSALLGLALARREAIRRGEPLDPFMAACAYTLGGAVAGARLYHVALNLDYFGRHPLKVFALWEGGAAIFGGVAGGVLLAAAYTWRHALPLGRYLDIMTPSLVLGQAIGRWGNFFNEEAFGPPTSLPWGLYVSPARRPRGMVAFEHFHPTFLYESLWNLAVFLVVFFVLRKRLARVPGALFLAYLALYSAGRLGLELLRVDSEMLGPFRSAQVAAAAGLVVAGVGLPWLWRRARRAGGSVGRV